MSENLNAEIAQWLTKASTVGATLKVDGIDHEAMASKHDALAEKHATIANVLGDASKATSDSRSSHFFANASKAHAHASDLHAKAADIHRTGSLEASEDATNTAMDASKTADATNEAAQKIAEAQAKGKEIVAQAIAGDASKVGKDAGFMFDGSADDSSDGDNTMDDSSEGDDDDSEDNSVSLPDLVIAAEKSADAGENYKKQSAQAYMNNDVEGAMQLSLLACDAYQTAHAYLRQAALLAGMNGGIVKSAVLNHDHPLAELVNVDQPSLPMRDGQIVEETHPLAELLNK
jgi:hypothetical protein